MYFHFSFLALISPFILGFRHEGRTWYTAHRGKLWIASAAKHPDQSEISDVELFYQRRSRHYNVTCKSHDAFQMSYTITTTVGQTSGKNMHSAVLS